jgi:arylsulfatase A-like enzyme
MRTNGSPDVQPFSAIRQGDWKLIFFHKDQHFELYNTRTDLSEKNNLFNLNPDKGQFLAKKLGEKLRNSNSKMLINREIKKEIIYPF